MGSQIPDREDIIQSGADLFEKTNRPLCQTDLFIVLRFSKLEMDRL